MRSKMTDAEWHGWFLEYWNEAINYSRSSEQLPDFLENVDGKIITTYIGGADVTDEWNEYKGN